MRLWYAVKLFGKFASCSLKSDMEYRINFISGILAEAGYMIVKLLYLFFVYQAGVRINGLSPDNIALFIGTYILMTGFYMVFYPNVWALQDSIKNGSLDLLLTKPVPIEFIATVQRLDFGMPLVCVSGGLIVLIHGWKQSGIPVTAHTVGGFLFFIAIGSCITYFLLIIPRLAAFWLTSIGGISQIADALWDFNNMPMAIYGKHIQRAGTFVLPIFIITNFPALFVLQKLPPIYGVWGIAVPCILWQLNRLIWKAGLKRYSSANV
ncbi:MAG: ABC-2 family transporter protein [Treponema sp.]